MGSGSDAYGDPAGSGSCTHFGPNVSTFLTPAHATTGCGGFHRRSPTGGAANGMPLNTHAPSTSVPAICPPSTFTISAPANRRCEPATVRAAASETITTRGIETLRSPAAAETDV